MANVVVSWIKQLQSMNTSLNDATLSIAIDPSGNIYVAYQTTGGTVSGGTFTGGTDDIVVFKMDTNGGVKWIKETALMNTNNIETNPEIATDSSGNVYVSYVTTGTVSGGTRRDISGNSNICVFKMDTDGAMIWIKEQALMNTLGNETSPSILVDSIGNVCIAYQTSDTVSGGTIRGGATIVVFKMDTNGAMIWIRQQFVMNPLTAAIAQYPKIAADPSGNIYVSYQITATVSGGELTGVYDTVVFKMDTNGTLQWIKQQAVMNTSLSDNDPMIAVDPSGNVYVSYRTDGTVSGGTSMGNSEIVVFKMDTNGVLQWIKQQREFNTTLNELSPTIAVDSTGNVYVSYHTQSVVSSGTSSGPYDIVILKMNNSGVLQWVKQQRAFNTSGSDTNPVIVLGSTGAIYISYQTAGTVSGGTRSGLGDIVVVKLIVSPDPPTAVTASVSGVSRQATVSWTAPTYIGGSAIIGYTATSSPGSITVTTTGATTATFTTLTDGALYTFTVTAANDGGSSVASTASAAVRPYTPLTTTTIPGASMAMWFDAADTSTVTGAVNVTAWADKSGSALSATPVSTAPTRTTLNNLNVLNFGAFVMKTTTNVVWSSTFTLFIVAKATLGKLIISSSNVSNNYGDYVYTGNGDLINVNNPTSNVSLFYGIQSGTTPGVPVVANDTWFIFTIGYDSAIPPIGTNYAVNGAVRTIQKNGGLGGSIVNTLPIYLNGNYGSALDSSQLAEVILYNTSVTSDQRQQVEGYLAQKWGLTATLVGFTAPGVPTSPTAVVSGVSGQAIVSWTAPASTGGATITGYSVISSPGFIMATTTGAVTVPVIGLTNGVAYTFTITATNAAGTTVPSAATASVTPYAAPDVVNVEWVTQQALMNTTGNDVSPTIAVDSTGNVYISYQTAGTVSGGTFVGVSDICVLKMNSSGAVQWIKEQVVMNTLVDDQYPRIAVDPSGNVYVTYYTGGTVSGGTFIGGVYDVAVFKMDSNGAVQWIKELALMNTTGADYNPALTVDSAGNVYISYNTTGTVSGGVFSGGADICVLKMNTSGAVQWIKEQAVMNTNGFDYNPSIAVDLTGNVYVSYYTGGTVSGGVLSGSNDIVVFKMDSSGVVQWIKESAIVNTTASDTVPSIAVDSAGNIYVTYSSAGTVSGGTFSGVFDIVIFKLNTSGDVQWVRQQQVMNTTASDTVPTIALDSASSIYISYQTTGTVSNGAFYGVSDTVVLKLNTSGQVKWIKELAVTNTTMDDTVPTIAVDLVGNIYVTYQTAGAVLGGTNSGGSDIVVFKMAQTPDVVTVEWIQQQTVMNTTAADTTPAVATDPSGNVFIAYQSTGTVSGGTLLGTSDIVVIKMNSSGVLQWIKEYAAMNTTLGDLIPTIGLDISGNIYVSYYTGGTVSGGTFLGGTTDIVVFKMDTNGSVQWIKEQAAMNTIAIDQRPATAVDPSGNVYVSYYTTGAVSGGTFLGGTSDVVVFKMNTSGVVQWIKQLAAINTTGVDQLPKIAVDPSGNVYVSYQTAGTVSGGTFIGGTADIVVFKMDTNGALQWIKELALMNTTVDDLTPAIAVDSSSNAYVTYSTMGTSSGGTLMGVTDIVVFKLNSSGQVQWIKQQQVMNTSLGDTAPTIAADSADGVYVSYQTAGTVSGGSLSGGTDTVVFKMNTSGVVQWIKQLATMNTTLNDTVPTIAVNAIGIVYVTYQTTGTVSGGTNFGSSDVVVFKMVQAPSPPTSISAVAGNALAIVSFTAPVVTGGYDVTSYTVTPSSGTATTGTSSPITVLGLTNGSVYTFTVQATNVIGISSASSASASITLSPPAPANLSASSPSVNTVFVQWDAAIGSTSSTQYVVTILPIRTTVTVLNNVTQVTITGLQSRIYTFTVRSEDSGVVSATSAETNPVIVMCDTSQYKFMLLNTPCKFNVFSAFQII